MRVEKAGGVGDSTAAGPHPPISIASPITVSKLVSDRIAHSLPEIGRLRYFPRLFSSRRVDILAAFRTEDCVMARIGIDARLVTYRAGGISQYTTHLIYELAALDRGG